MKRDSLGGSGHTPVYNPHILPLRIDMSFYLTKLRKFFISFQCSLNIGWYLKACLLSRWSRKKGVRRQEVELVGCASSARLQIVQSVNNARYEPVFYSWWNVDAGRGLTDRLIVRRALILHE